MGKEKRDNNNIATPNSSVYGGFLTSVLQNDMSYKVPFFTGAGPIAYALALHVPAQMALQKTNFPGCSYTTLSKEVLTNFNKGLYPGMMRYLPTYSVPMLTREIAPNFTSSYLATSALCSLSETLCTLGYDIKMNLAGFKATTECHIKSNRLSPEHTKNTLPSNLVRNVALEMFVPTFIRNLLVPLAVGGGRKIAKNADLPPEAERAMPGILGFFFGAVFHTPLSAPITTKTTERFIEAQKNPASEKGATHSFKEGVKNIVLQPKYILENLTHGNLSKMVAGSGARGVWLGSSALMFDALNRWFEGNKTEIILPIKNFIGSLFSVPSSPIQARHQLFQQKEATPVAIETPDVTIIQQQQKISGWQQHLNNGIKVQQQQDGLERY